MGKTYIIKVCAGTAKGWGKWSQPVTATVLNRENNGKKLFFPPFLFNLTKYLPMLKQCLVFSSKLLSQKYMIYQFQHKQ